MLSTYLPRPALLFMALPLAVLLSGSPVAMATPPEAMTVKPPPSAQLLYSAKADVRGMALDGQSQIDWNSDARGYALMLETRTALTGILLQEKSEGGFDRHGFAPNRYTARRLMKSPTTTVFDRRAGAIDFAGERPAHALQGGEQDRVSVLWQLMSMMRARPAAFAVGSRWNFFVAGPRGGDAWTFEVKAKQRLRSSLGELDTLYVAQLAEDAANRTHVEVWFAPSQEWFPVRIRFSEPNGDFIEQSLERITRK
jgi:hypothetical protein